MYVEAICFTSFGSNGGCSSLPLTLVQGMFRALIEGCLYQTGSVAVAAATFAWVFLPFWGYVPAPPPSPPGFFRRCARENSIGSGLRSHGVATRLHTRHTYWSGRMGEWAQGP